MKLSELVNASNLLKAPGASFEIVSADNVKMFDSNSYGKNDPDMVRGFDIENLCKLGLDVTAINVDGPNRYIVQVNATDENIMYDPECGCFRTMDDLMEEFFNGLKSGEVDKYTSFGDWLDEYPFVILSNFEL